MKLFSTIAGCFLIAAIAVPATIWIGYAELTDGSLNPLTLSTCITETREEVRGIGGGDFSVEYTNCDTLAKDEAIRVFASRPLIGNWLKRKTLLFRYDPGRYDAALPTITAPQPNKIVISVPSVSSIALQKREWRGSQVAYQIGHVDFP